MNDRQELNVQQEVVEQRDVGQPRLKELMFEITITPVKKGDGSRQKRRRRKRRADGLAELFVVSLSAILILMVGGLYKTQSEEIDSVATDTAIYQKSIQECALDQGYLYVAQKTDEGTTAIVCFDQTMTFEVMFFENEDMAVVALSGGGGAWTVQLDESVSCQNGNFYLVGVDDFLAELSRLTFEMERAQDPIVAV